MLFSMIFPIRTKMPLVKCRVRLGNR